eukprot:28539-Pyramimonas_sp.AAC.1
MGRRIIGLASADADDRDNNGRLQFTICCNMFEQVSRSIIVVFIRRHLQVWRLVTPPCFDFFVWRLATPLCFERADDV